MKKLNKKKVIVICVVAVIAILACAEAIRFSIRVHKDGQQYLYIDYYDGTTRELYYYIDEEEGNAYYWEDYGRRKKGYVLVGDHILEKNKAGQLVYDYREELSSKEAEAIDQEKVSSKKTVDK